MIILYCVECHQRNITNCIHKFYSFETFVVCCYDSDFFYGIIARRTVQSCIVFHGCDEKNLQRLVMRLSAVIQMVELVSLPCM